MSKKTAMYYDKEQDQWMVYRGQEPYPMYCGEHLNLFIGKQGFPCRLELDWSWYVIFPDTRCLFIKHRLYRANLSQ